MKEHIKYFLRVDVHGRRPDSHGWWMIDELDNDAYPVGAPTVVWTEKTTVQVTVSTRTLSGTLFEHAGDDIKIEIASSLFGVGSHLLLNPQQMFFSSAERRFSVPA